MNVLEPLELIINRKIRLGMQWTWKFYQFVYTAYQASNVYISQNKCKYLGKDAFSVSLRFSITQSICMVLKENLDIFHLNKLFA